MANGRTAKRIRLQTEAACNAKGCAVSLLRKRIPAAPSTGRLDRRVQLPSPCEPAYPPRRSSQNRSTLVPSELALSITKHHCPLPLQGVRLPETNCAVSL